MELTNCFNNNKDNLEKWLSCGNRIYCVLSEIEHMIIIELALNIHHLSGCLNFLINYAKTLICSRVMTSGSLIFFEDSRPRLFKQCGGCDRATKMREGIGDGAYII